MRSTGCCSMIFCWIICPIVWLWLYLFFASCCMDVLWLEWNEQTFNHVSWRGVPVDSSKAASIVDSWSWAGRCYHWSFRRPLASSLLLISFLVICCWSLDRFSLPEFMLYLYTVVLQQWKCGIDFCLKKYPVVLYGQVVWDHASNYITLTGSCCTSHLSIVH